MQCERCGAVFDPGTKQQVYAAHRRWCGRRSGEAQAGSPAPTTPAFVHRPVALEDLAPPATETGDDEARVDAPAAASSSASPLQPAAPVAAPASLATDAGAQLPELRPPTPQQAPFVGRMPPPPAFGVLRLVPKRIDGGDEPAAETAAAGPTAGATAATPAPAPPAAGPPPAEAPPPAPARPEPGQVAAVGIFEIVVARVFPGQPLTQLERKQLEQAMPQLLSPAASLWAVLAAVLIPRLLMTERGQRLVDRLVAKVAPTQPLPAPAAAPAATTPGAEAAPTARPTTSERAPTAPSPLALSPEAIAESYRQQSRARGVDAGGAGQAA